MNWLSPTLWNNIGVVALAVFVSIAIARGWLIPKSLHREIIVSKDATIADLRSRATSDAAIIRLQAETNSFRDGAELTATRLLRETRDAAMGEH